jgi:TFIIF, beta subunit HTH domain
LITINLFLQDKQKKVTPTKGTEMKRTRRDRREMEDIIFKLFERQPNWALKQLVQETDQPEVFHSLPYSTNCFGARILKSEPVLLFRVLFLMPVFV